MESAEKIVVTPHYGFAYEKPDESSQPVSDVVAGNRLKREGGAKDISIKCLIPTDGKHMSFEIHFPTGSGMASFTENKMLKVSLKQLTDHGNSLIYGQEPLPREWIVADWHGPYFLCMTLLSREMPQQAYVSEHIYIAPDLHVKRGDLVFFGRKATAERKEGISHVGIYLGNKQFIHALGDVHVSSMNPCGSKP